MKFHMKLRIIFSVILIFAPDLSVQFRRWDFHERCPLVRIEIKKLITLPFKNFQFWETTLLVFL